jgi:predicted ATPase
VVDLGSHQLRDLPERLQLFQLGSGEFAALRGVEGARDSLPSRRTRLIGRDREVGEIVGLLGSSRLVTIVGPGGIGKTSAALETAGKVSGSFPGGAHFVDLATVTDGDDVVGAVCRGIQLVVGAAPYDELVAFLTDSEVLLVVDNCEHVIDDAASVVDRLLSDLPGLRVLATSREHLDLDGEQVLALGPLAVDGASAATRLFVERVVAVRADFDPDDDDLKRIASICGRLDGLPLAIELAAGRARTMSLAEIEERLDDRFSLLAGGRRGKFRRQQTLRATLDWSIELLDPEEAELLARLAVYVSGFDFEGAEAVMPFATGRVSDLVASLAAKSLAQRVADEGERARYRLLETVREWGLEELARRSLLREARDLHARRYIDAHAHLDLYDLGSVSTSRRWEPELPDLVAAMVHLREDDPVGVAIVVVPYDNTLAEHGYGALALEILAEGRAAAPPERTALLWTTRRTMQMMMGVGGFLDRDADPAPADDGSPEWRWLVGGAEHEYAGLEGWYATWLAPGAVAETVESLEPPEADVDSLMLRSFALSNACLANFHLGRCDAALEAWRESRRFAADAGREYCGSGTDWFSAVGAAVARGIDIRGTELEWETTTGRGVFMAMLRALSGAAPEDRPVELARAARAESHSRIPGEEEIFLTQMAAFAIDEGDLDRGDHLNNTTAFRTPASFSLKRHNMIRARGLPLELIDDEAHHLEFFLETTRARDPAHVALNRQKMLDEIARRLD